MSEKITRERIEADARKFVSEWLWQEKYTGRQTSGMEWGSRYLQDAAKMCADYLALRATEQPVMRPSEQETLMLLVRGLLEELKLHFQRGNPDDARYTKLSAEEKAAAFVASAERASREGDLLYLSICTMLQRLDALAKGEK